MFIKFISLYEKNEMFNVELFIFKSFILFLIHNIGRVILQFLVAAAILLFRVICAQ